MLLAATAIKIGELGVMLLSAAGAVGALILLGLAIGKLVGGKWIPAVAHLAAAVAVAFLATLGFQLVTGGANTLTGGATGGQVQTKVSIPTIQGQDPNGP